MSEIIAPPPPPVSAAQHLWSALSHATNQVAAARAALAVAQSRLHWAQLRRIGAPFGSPAWIMALAVGSVAAFALALLIIATRATGLGGPLMAAAFGYVLIGGPLLWILRDAPGDVENRTFSRAEAVFKAATERDGAAAQLNSSLAAQAQHKRAWDEHQAQVNSVIHRLLAVEPGRLYPAEFERFVGDIFRHLGYEVTQRGKSGDQGVDVVARKGSIAIAIQAKCHTNNVGNSCVQEAYAGMAHYRCQRCMVVTSSYFTFAAIELAASTGCVLIDRDRIPALIRGEFSF